MTDAIRAVLFGMRYRPGVWLVCGLGWIVYGTFSAKIVPLIIYLTGDPSFRDQLLPTLLPDAIPATVLGAYPLFGAIFMVALGGLVIGNEYRWGTIGTLLVQRASRTEVALSQAAALGVVTFVTSVGYAVVNTVVSLVIAAALGASTALPAALPLLGAVAGSWLIAFVYAMIGGAVAHLFRSAIAAVGAAIVLVIVVENVLGLLAGFLPGVRWVQAILPGPSGGALAAAAGAPAGTPGLVAVAPVGVGIAVLLGWIVVCVGCSVALVRIRDVTP
ncbi:hypothetical protein [Pseudonocardia sp.]|uniref:hypothetical protein n=1 Tax=Pseudonocardia sp. TaxID=60912 RepID=UPI00261A1CF0|nr:hypothetical protein [Pseudonocardia sp.]